MATLYVTEYSGIADGSIQVPISPALKANNVAITANSVQSLEFTENTKLIRVHPDAICSVQITKNPTATTSSKRMAADTTEFFAVRPGDRIAVIANV